MQVQHLTRASPRVNSVLCRICVLRLELIPLSLFVLSHAGNEELVLVHLQVLLRLLVRVQPLAHLQPLRDLYCLTPEEEALLPSPPLAFDSHCHIDRIQTDFRLARSANIHKPARKKTPINLHLGPPDDHVVSRESVVASFCDTLRGVHQMWNRAQVCFVCLFSA